MIRIGSKAGVWAFLVLAWLFASGAMLPAQAASGVLDVDDKVNGIDISKAGEPLATDRVEINVQGPQEADKTKLVAKGPGPSYYWSLYSLHNVTDVPLDFVLTVKGQYFVGSGSIKVPRAGPNAVSAVLTKNSQSLPIFDAGWAQAIQVHVLPHDSTNVAIETLSPNIPATLWQSAAYQALHANHAYYIGLAEGVMMLVVMGLFGLYAYRAHRAALAAAFLAAAYLAFVDIGVNSSVGRILPAGLTPNLIRAVAESLMVAALALCAATFMGRQVFGGWWQRAMVVVAVLALANLGYGLAEPLAATLLARIAFVLLALAAVFVGLRMRNAGREVVDPSGILWLSLFCWLIVVVAVALDQSHSAIRAPQLAIVTAAFLVALVVVMLRNTATLGLSARPFITDANLRSLALSAGRHIMWDWVPEQGKLEISGELERSLDLAIEQTADSRLEQFYAAMHPLDLGAYKKLAERFDYKPGERLQLELRLQHGDGTYHWYELQARAVPGPDNTVDRCIGTLTSIGKLKTVEERLANDALQDAVSGLPNKALFTDRVDRSLGKLGALPLRVIIVDIDRFKTLNEGLGQDVGDRILKVTADRLVGFVEDNETVARMNGGQFALECAETIDRGDFNDFVVTLQAQLAAPIKHGAQQVVLSTSLGVSMSGKAGAKSQDLIDQATVAMLEARGEGGARAEFYHAELKDDRADQLSLESDLREALNQNEIAVYYQPIVALATLDVVGFEALARWHHPQLGLLSPSDFMEIAETAGMMPEIGHFMISGAARQLGIWQRVHMRGKPFFVSVNASATQLANAEFPVKVQQVLKRENLVPDSLKIEITETVIMRQPERSARLLQQLKAMGVGLACDDFGTGFSSLASLRDFPFDTLKLDRSFIALEDFDDRNGKIITSITTLAHSLGMTVVGEGIETQAQIDRLASLGCELGQGFLIGAPETAEAASARLTQMLLGRHLVTPTLTDSSEAAPTNLYEPVPSLVPLTPTSVPTSLLHPMFVEELPSIFSMASSTAKPKPKRSKPQRKLARKKRR